MEDKSQRFLIIQKKRDNVETTQTLNIKPQGKVLHSQSKPYVNDAFDPLPSEAVNQYKYDTQSVEIENQAEVQQTEKTVQVENMVGEIVSKVKSVFFQVNKVNKRFSKIRSSF